MAERVWQRRRRGVIWRDETNPRRLIYRGLPGPVYYPSVLDGDPDTAIDLTAQRIQTAQLDGWRITANDWHYAIGQPGTGVFAGQDGVVGFGGRQGSHWFRFRLIRFGYLHYPTRAWDDLGGPPTYSRANLSRTTGQRSLGDQTFTLASSALWSGLWTTPGGGDVSIRWKVQSNHLKEEITVNQAARDWVAANRPPTTPASETYFGCVFRLDLSDVPRIYKNGLEQNKAGDFDDDAGTARWFVRDAQDRLLAFLPISDLFSEYYSVSGIRRRDRLRLRKRLWLDGDGNTYLLVGVRVSDLAGFRAGALTFDPTFDIAESAEDASSWGTDEDITGAVFGDVALGWNAGGPGGNFNDGAWIFRGTGIESGNSIDTATLFLRYNAPAGGSLNLPLVGDVFCFDVDSPSDFSDSDSHRVSDHHTRTSASVAANIGSAADYTTASLVTPVQAVVDRAGFAGDIGLTWRSGGSTDEFWYTYDYSDGAANAAELTVTWAASDPDSRLRRREHRPAAFFPGLAR